MTDLPGAVTGPAADRSAAVRSRRAAVLLTGAGAGAGVLASGRTWATARVQGLPGAGLVHAAGGAVSPAGVAVCLAAALGAVVLGTAGPRVRLLVAVLLVLAGIGVAAPALQTVFSPRGAVLAAVTQATGTTGTTAPVTQQAATGWPWLAAGGGGILAAGGALGLARGRRWPAPARRYEAVAVAGAAPALGARDAALQEWNALSRGEDPTR